jgi:predicted nucleotide-binding protein
VVEDALRVMASRLPRGQARAWEGEVYDVRGAILFEFSGCTFASTEEGSPLFACCEVRPKDAISDKARSIASFKFSRKREGVRSAKTIAVSAVSTQDGVLQMHFQEPLHQDELYRLMEIPTLCQSAGPRMRKVNSDSALPDKYWHCRVSIEGKRGQAIVNDLTLDVAKRTIIEPWISGTQFVVSGVLVKSRNVVTAIKLVQTSSPLEAYASEYNSRMRSKNISDMATDRRILPFKDGRDYTFDLLVAPTSGDAVGKSYMPSNKVFVVHGHDDGARESVARFLQSAGFEPIILHERASAGRTVIEKVERYGADVSFAVVLLTPDDVGSAKGAAALESRARQNVLLELGYFMGRLGRDRVCVLRKSDVSIPSDFAGTVWVDLDAAGAWRTSLAKELRDAGHQVDLAALVGMS